MTESLFVLCTSSFWSCPIGHNWAPPRERRANGVRVVPGLSTGVKGPELLCRHQGGRLWTCSPIRKWHQGATVPKFLPELHVWGKSHVLARSSALPVSVSHLLPTSLLTAVPPRPTQRGARLPSLWKTGCWTKPQRKELQLHMAFAFAFSRWRRNRYPRRKTGKKKDGNWPQGKRWQDLTPWEVTFPGEFQRLFINILTFISV